MQVVLPRDACPAGRAERTAVIYRKIAELKPSIFRNIPDGNYCRLASQID
jgi:hypothetical protein